MAEKTPELRNHMQVAMYLECLYVVNTIYYYCATLVANGVTFSYVRQLEPTVVTLLPNPAYVRSRFHPLTAFSYTMRAGLSGQP